MAKAKDLAALAGLAGLAYHLRNKGDKDNTTSPAYPSGVMGGAPEESRRKIEDYQKKAPLDGTEMYPSGVMGGAKQASATRSLKPAADNTTATAMPSGIMGGSSAPASTASSSAEGMKNYKPRRTPPPPSNTVSSSEEGMKKYKSRRAPATLMASGGRTVSKKELEESGLSLRDFLNKEKGLTRKAPEGMTREYKPRDASDQASKKSMSAESGASRGSRNFAGSGRGESGGASSDSLSRFNAGKEGYDEVGNAMKRGGSVKKMASGGMTASRRADGIASRGKTRGKIC